MWAFGPSKILNLERETKAVDVNSRHQVNARYQAFNLVTKGFKTLVVCPVPQVSIHQASFIVSAVVGSWISLSKVSLLKSIRQIKTIIKTSPCALIRSYKLSRCHSILSQFILFHSLYKKISTRRRHHHGKPINHTYPLFMNKKVVFVSRHQEGTVRRGKRREKKRGKKEGKEMRKFKLKKIFTA